MRTPKHKILFTFLLLTVHIYGQPRKHSVIINTVPHSAQVYANGKLLAKTPCGFSAPEKFRLNLEIKKDGYESWTRNYIVQDDIDIDIILNSISANVLKKSSYDVSFKTLPEKVNVTVNGISKGTTPYNDHFPAGTRIDIIFSKPGYQDWKQSLVINDEIKKKIKLNYQAISQSPKRLWLIPVAAVVGVGAYYFLSSQSDNTSDADPWPSPPSRPATP